jgi:hypothetical protein
MVHDAFNRIIKNKQKKGPVYFLVKTNSFLTHNENFNSSQINPFVVTQYVCGLYSYVFSLIQ